MRGTHSGTQKIPNLFSLAQIATFSVWNHTYVYVPQTSWGTSFPRVAIGISPSIYPANLMEYISHTISVFPVVASVGFSSLGTHGTFPFHPRLSDFPLCVLTLLHLFGYLLPPSCSWSLLNPAVWVYCCLRPLWMKNEPFPTHGMGSLFLMTTFRFLLFLLMHWLLISTIFYLLLLSAVIYWSSPPSLKMSAPRWWSSASGVSVC